MSSSSASDRASAEIEASIHIHDCAFFGAVAFGGSIGAGGGYMRGYWTTNDLSALVRLFIRNQRRSTAWKADSRGSRRRFDARLHRLSRNTRAGCRRNIAAHYDLGNDLFALFLDETMVYSSAIFDRTRRICMPPRSPSSSACAASSRCGRTTICWKSAGAGALSPFTRRATTAAA